MGMGRDIDLHCYGIKVHLNDEGTSGTIVSDLHEQPDEEVEGGSEADTSFDRYDAAMDAIESMVLSHACAGIDIASPGYLEGIETAVQACVHNFGR